MSMKESKIAKRLQLIRLTIGSTNKKYIKAFIKDVRRPSDRAYLKVRPEYCNL